MSLTPLATLLNNSAGAGAALITESEGGVSVSELHAAVAKRIIEELEAVNYQYRLFDGAHNQCEKDEIEDGEEGYLIVFKILVEEPVCPDTLYLLTESGLTDYLRAGHLASRWRVVGLSKPIYGKARVIGNWEDELAPIGASPTKSPRLLVKEAADFRVVPENVQVWLLDESRSLDFSQSFHRLWARFAYEALCRCMANEIESAEHKLIFKGPPKLALKMLGDDPVCRAQVSVEDFDRLHESAAWVYENAREAEIKHVLLSTEIARAGRSDGEVVEYFRGNMEAAFECAKIAYQMAISDVTKDTLKSLGDLRKAVTEETAKVNDSTRQIVTAIASALAVGLGMIVARVSVALNAWLIVLVMLTAFGYVVLIALSGWHFIKVQRSLRTQWQLKLYRFLSADDYKTMVADPVGASERVYRYSALGGGAVLLVAAVSISIFAFFSSAEVRNAVNTTQPSVPKATPAPERPDSNGTNRLNLPETISA